MNQLMKVLIVVTVLSISVVYNVSTLCRGCVSCSSFCKKYIPSNCGDCYNDCCNTNCCETCCDDSCDDCCNSCNPLDNCDTCCGGHSFLTYRSQGVNIARRIVGIQQNVNKCNVGEWYGSFYVLPEFTRSFRGCQIAQFLLGSNTILVQGSQVPDRNNKAWLADYFGLPVDFKSIVTFKPRIQNFIVDLGMYIGLNEWARGLFFRLYTPITYTKLELCPCETISTSTQTFVAGYMSKTEIERDNLPKKFLDYMKGGITFGDMKEGMRYGKIDSCKHHKAGLADIRAELGWNFVCNEEQNYHLGLTIHTAAPTGNRPCAGLLFEPIIGNGKHWELGAGITSSAILWRSKECPEKAFGIYLDAAITHLFKTRQFRSFNLRCKPNSRYMLLEEMGANEDNHLTNDSDPKVPANYVYTGNLISAINATTLNVDVTINIQADLAIKFSYMTKNWSSDIGYNLWARTGEKFCLDCYCDFYKKYAIKGDASIYGKEENENNTIRHLSATQSEATIYSGKNWPLETEETNATALQNPKIDNPQHAFYDDVQLVAITTDNNVNTSIQPILVSFNDLDIRRSPSALSHKIFAHFNYAWNKTDEHLSPYLGIGGEVEFGGTSKNCRSSINQWGIWLKGGISFD